jgi:hypothetical protein
MGHSKVKMEMEGNRGTNKTMSAEATQQLKLIAAQTPNLKKNSRRNAICIYLPKRLPASQ